MTFLKPRSRRADTKDVAAAYLAVLHLGLAAVVWEDARRRDWTGDRVADRPWKWALGAATIWYITLPAYLRHRRTRPLLA